MLLPVISKLTGVLLTYFSIFAFLVPACVAFFYGEIEVSVFLTSFSVTFFIGAALWFYFREAEEFRGAGGFLLTALFYVGLGLFGALPLILSTQPGLSFSDGVFESVSGLTTTGATTISGLDSLPKSILFYRHLLQWFGGMGIIVFAVAFLPVLGVGQMQLYHSEASGPDRDAKLTPRIAESAKFLWLIYAGLTLICVISYFIAGMNLFDAICHAFSTVAIGGFSTHDQSFQYFDLNSVKIVAIFFMIVSGINFALHFSVLKRKNPLLYLADAEVRTYFLVLLLVSLFLVAVFQFRQSDSDANSVDHLFQAVSFATTTGFVSSELYLWPPIAQVVLILAAFAGGCAGSTAGGIKIIRVLTIWRQGAREIKRLVHPNGVFHVKVGGQPVTEPVLNSIWSFVSVYIFLFFFSIVLIMTVSDLDFLTSFSAVSASLNNLGPGLGMVGESYEAISAPVKWILIINMMLGRLELFTILVLFTPYYWRR
tara:strand:- start:599 stop:2047 length:1449 start_codon:yes stop_codon:yes gene_type:complete